MDIKSKWDMFAISFFERDHHTNPSMTVYLRAPRIGAALRMATEYGDALAAASVFEKITAEFALWKQEEEVCTPWNKVELP